ncbi:MAG: Ig-like domain-containing protein [Bacteroidales bacterium]|nr:Ig-like domain-containing protein [Bacteroidales bacterium]MDY6002156.1 Ig-like domain-containing protein [Candidatus Cryptobacteroides sp.]
MIFSSFIFMNGCDKTSRSTEYKLQRIHVNVTALDLQVGDKVQLTATAVPSVAIEPTYLWASTDVAVVSVSNGIVEAKKAGKADIVVSVQNEKTVIPVTVTIPEYPGGSLLYNLKPCSLNRPAELLLNDAGSYATEGLDLTTCGKLAKLERFYALGERMIRYLVRPSGDAVVLFQSSMGDFSAYLSVAEKKILIGTAPASETAVPFLQGDRDYEVEIYHIYNLAKVRVIDVLTRESAEVYATMDGTGGCGKGALQKGFSVGMQWDHYCFGLKEGTSALIKRLTVFSLKKKVKLLLYGDSISQPEGYFPLKDFPHAWTQRIIARLGGDAMSSGRGGGTILTVLDYIKNELPFIEAKYVMVTVGTNGSNTEANLTEVVRYIKSQGAIPILNNIPCNESGTQIENNALIEKVRSKLGIKGCRFDLATSLAGDGKEVDKSMMFWEDYSGSYGWQIYHHPNGKGGKMMYERTLIDVPEIYE